MDASDWRPDPSRASRRERRVRHPEIVRIWWLRGEVDPHIVERMFDHGDASGPESREARAHRLLDRVLSTDPTATGAELSAAIESRAELAAITDGAVVALVPQWEASVDWANDGSATAVTWTVNHTGAAKSAAGALRKTGLLAASMPYVTAAAVAGELPLSHLHLLTRARTTEVAEVFDREEADLVAEARTLTADRLVMRLMEWRYQALAELARNDPDPRPGPETENDTASIVQGFMGRGIVTADLTPETLAIWVEAVHARIETWRRSGQLDSDDRTYAELVCAAITDLIADGSTSSRRGQPRPLLIAIATLSALLDHAGIPATERDRWQATILGGGPMSQAALRELIERANIVFAITTDDGEPLYLGRARRLATAAMLLALIARSGGTCEFPGCHANHHRCHAHHINWWRHDGFTDINNLALLCPHHHRLVHHGWTLTRGPTGLDFRRTNHTPIPKPHYRNTAFNPPLTKRSGRRDTTE